MDYGKYLEKVFSEMRCRERRFMTFRPNDEYYDDIHGIVCLNMSILYTSVHLGMENNVAEESFHFLWTKKSFFTFRVPKMGCFVKELTKICYKIESHQLYKIQYHIWCTNNQIFMCQRFPYASHQKDKFLTIRLEPGQIWTTTAS